MRQEPSNWSCWSSWGNQATETLERYGPRSIPEPVDEQNNNYDPHLIQAREASVQDAYVVDNAAQVEEYRAWTDSEGYVAARVLQAIREGERLSICSYYGALYHALRSCNSSSAYASQLGVALSYEIPT
jgi:hypothetical protein